MSDIAVLGLQVDSTSVITATTALKGLTAAAGPAASAAAQLTRTTAGASAAMEAASLSIRGQRQVLRGMVADIALLNPAFGGVAGTLAQLYVRNAAVFRGFDDFKQTLAGIITPARLVTAGVVATGVGAYAAYEYWKNYALQLDHTAKRMGETTIEASKLQSAAEFKGISAEDFAKGMAQFSDQVYLAKNNMGDLAELARANRITIDGTSDALEKVADLVQRAGSEQQKYVILQQAGLPATSEWVRLLSQGAAGIRKAKAEAAEFGGAINDEMVAKAKAFDDAWNKGWSNFTKNLRGAVVDGISWFDRFGDDVTAVLMRIESAGKSIPANVFALLTGGTGGARLLGSLGTTATPDSPSSIPTNMLKSAFAGTFTGSRLTPNSDVSSLYGKTGADTGTRLTVNAIDPNIEKGDLAREQQRISLLGNLATTTDLVRQKQIELRLAYLSTGASVGNMAEAVKRQAEWQAEANKISAAAAYGIYDQGRAATNARRELQTLVDNGTIKSAEDYAAATAVVNKRLREMSENAQVARSSLEGVTRYGLDAANSMKQWDGVLTSAFSNGETAFGSWVSGAKNFKSVFSDMTSSVLQDIAKMMFRMNVTGPLAGLINSGASGGSTFMPSASFMDHGFGFGHSGMIVGGTPTFSRNVNPSVFAGAPRFHTGGIAHDEVPIIAKKGEGIFTPAQMRNLAPAGRGGAAPMEIHIHEAPAGTQVKQSQRPDGGVRLDITLKRLIDDTTAGLIRGGDSATHDAIKDRFNVRPAI